MFFELLDQVDSVEYVHPVSKVTPLMKAALTGDPVLFHRVMEKSRRWEQQLEDKVMRASVLFYAIRGGSLKIVEKLIQELPSLLKVTDSYGRTVLHLAEIYNDADICNLLKEKCNELNERIERSNLGGTNSWEDF